MSDLSSQIFELIRWWEKRRVWYNAIMGIIGIAGACFVMLRHHSWHQDFLRNIVGAGYFAVMANVCFTTGWALPLWVAALRKDQGNLGKYRVAMFIVGTLLSILLMVWMIVDYKFHYSY